MENKRARDASTPSPGHHTGYCDSHRDRRIKMNEPDEHHTLVRQGSNQDLFSVYKSPSPAATEDATLAGEDTSHATTQEAAATTQDTGSCLAQLKDILLAMPQAIGGTQHTASKLIRDLVHRVITQFQFWNQVSADEHNRRMREAEAAHTQHLAAFWPYVQEAEEAHHRRLEELGGAREQILQELATAHARTMKDLEDAKNGVNAARARALQVQRDGLDEEVDMLRTQIALAELQSVPRAIELLSERLVHAEAGLAKVFRESLLSE